MDNLGKIESVSDYLNKTEGVHYLQQEDIRFFCRGQGSMLFKLRPKIGRYKYATPLINDVPDWQRKLDLMVTQFEREYITHHTTALSRKVDRLTLAQHYGLATQLLDWTLNPLIALYFSCSSHKDQDGIVFIFNPGPSTSLNIINDADLEKDIDWHILRPMRLDQRMINQDTVFTYHKDPTKDFAEELGNHCSGVTVPADKKTIILGQLASIGIHDAFVFPGLHTICERIDSAYRGKNSYEDNKAFFPDEYIEGEAAFADEREPYLKP